MSRQESKIVAQNDEWAKQGLKMSILGPYFWIMYGILAVCWSLKKLENRNRELEKFMFGALADLLPCIFCRNSFTHIWNTSTNMAGIKMPTFDWFWDQNRLDDWWFMIHNAVNEKLDKPILLASKPRIWDFSSSLEMEREFEKCFWICLWSVCVNFPADMSIEEMEKCGENMEKMKKRIKTYILWIEQLKNVLPAEFAICQKWNRAYFKHAPSRLAFSCRSELVNWLFTMSEECMNKKHLSLHQLVEPFHKLRADLPNKKILV